ncbi:hypothetical protein IAR50_005790 [Cryptococcus sp. DSM 104548]
MSAFFSPGRWATEPLFLYVSHVAFGEEFMSDLGIEHDREKSTPQDCYFGPGLKDMCMRPSNAFYAEGINGPGQFPTKYVAQQPSNVNIISHILECHLRFGKGDVEGTGTPLTFHNARPNHFLKGTANTVVYDMDRAEGEYGVGAQLDDTKAYIQPFMDRLGSRVISASSVPKVKPSMIRFTNIHLQSNCNLLAFFIEGYHRGQNPRCLRPALEVGLRRLTLLTERQHARAVAMTAGTGKTNPENEEGHKEGAPVFVHFDSQQVQLQQRCINVLS